MEENHVYGENTKNCHHQVIKLITPSDLKDIRLLVKNPCCSVYRAFYQGRAVAIKIFELQLQRGTPGEKTSYEDEKRKYMFEEEAMVWRGLNHRNVTRFIGEIRDVVASDICKEWSRNKVCYGIVMEFMAHDTLRKYVTRKSATKLPFTRVVDLALDLAKGLEYLHSVNIVHRDVKTENLLLDRNDVLKIADFGVSTEEDPDWDECLMCKTGTYGYMAPEILLEKPYNRKCDVFSFGICLWEFYCCERPYESFTSYELGSPQVMKDIRPDIPKSCPGSLAKIMRSCWETEPSKRPEMSDVVLALEDIRASIHPRPRCCFRLWK